MAPPKEKGECPHCGRSETFSEFVHAHWYEITYFTCPRCRSKLKCYMGKLSYAKRRRTADALA